MTDNWPRWRADLKAAQGPLDKRRPLSCMNYDIFFAYTKTFLVGHMTRFVNITNLGAAALNDVVKKIWVYHA